MVEFSSITNTIMGGSGAVVTSFIWIVIIGAVAIVLLGLALWLWMRKRWNLRIEIKLPRSDGKIINSEWGKGLYNAQRGCCFIKRPGSWRAIASKPFDLKMFVQGNDTVTFIQLGPEDYRPVLPQSWTETEVTEELVEIDDNTGKPTGKTKIVTRKMPIMNIKIDTGMDKAWKSAFENASKKQYSISSFIEKFQTPIAIGIVLISCFIGFAVLYSRC